MARRIAFFTSLFLIATAASAEYYGRATVTTPQNPTMPGLMIVSASFETVGMVLSLGEAFPTTGGPTPTGTFQFLLDGNVIPACSAIPLNPQGISTCAITLPAGEFTFTAKYGGDGVHLPANSLPHTQVVLTERIPSTISLASSKNPAAFGTAFNYAAVVTGAAGPASGGTVDFRQGDVTLCSARPVMSGVATCVVTPMALGDFDIQASFSGNSGYLPSGSPTYTQSVNAPTTLVLTSPVRPSYFGRATTLTASISSPAGPPSVGTVTFARADNSLVAGCENVSVSAGVASCFVGILPEGSNVFVATYNGTTLYPSQVATWNQTVLHAPRKRVDFNGDGNADIIWKHTDGRQALWMVDGTMVVDSFAMIGPGTGWSVSQVGDFNGDGKSDILWVHTDGASALWLINGHAQVGGGRLFAGGSGWSPAAVADLNGDGKSDIVWTHTDGSIAVWIMDGFKQVGGARLLGPGTGWVLKRVQDFDTDLKADLLLEHADGRSKVVLLDGAASRGEFTLNAAGSGWSVNGWSRVGDTSQVYSRHTDGRVMITYINGRVLDTMTWEPQTWTPSLTAVLNGAGSPEMLRQYRDGSLHAYYGDAIPAGSPYTLLRLADFNNDGIADVLAVHTDGSVAMRLGGGYGWGEFITVLGPGTGWTPYFIDDDWSEWIARH